MFGPTAFFLIFYLLVINPYLIAVCLVHSAAPSSVSSGAQIAYASPACLFEMKRGRPTLSSHVDLDPQVAHDFFTDHMQVASGPTNVWPYSKGRAADSKKTIVWCDIKRIPQQINDQMKNENCKTKKTQMSKIYMDEMI